MPPALAAPPALSVAPLAAGATAWRALGADLAEARQIVLVCGGFHFPRNCDAFFEALAPRLPEHTALLLFDWLGRGESARPRGARWDQTLYLEQIEGLLTHLGLGQRRLTVLGYSFGGAVAVHLAARWPERVERLILSGAWATFAPIPGVARAICSVPMLMPLMDWAYWATLTGYVRRGFDRPDEARIEAAMAPEQAYRAADPVGLREALLGTMRDFPTDTAHTAAEVARHPRPAWLIWGAHDAVSPAALAREAAARWPAARWVELPGNHNDLWLQDGLRERLLEVMAEAISAQII